MVYICYMEGLLKRILEIKENSRLTNSEFADALDIPRSSVSHLLSGRNKPSLDLIYKVLATFPNTSTDWLMFGKGMANYTQRELDLKEEVKPDELSKKEETLKKEREIEQTVRHELICLFEDGQYKRFIEKN